MKYKASLEPIIFNAKNIDEANQIVESVISESQIFCDDIEEMDYYCINHPQVPGIQKVLQEGKTVWLCDDCLEEVLDRHIEKEEGEE